MGRPPRFPVDDLLDAALQLFAAGGTEAVTMSALARAVGAPSGSVYHRFSGRPALLAALWLRTVRRFQSDYRAVLGDEPSVADVVEATASVVRWCRSNPAAAQVLYAGKRALGFDTWSAEDRAAADRTDADLDGILRTAPRPVRAATGLGTDELLLVLIDLPYAAVRRYLAQGRPPPVSAAGLVARAARTLLTGEGKNDG
ncbi:TetR/AcrR family transcriptional regulator [Amycolatopsis ruanii]|uniref:TetR/AcrR family transcriptional regulator n=1 Tax=Amycolatopsis ruanii TaxID=944491 RepID=UPI000E24BD57|nr:TetR/AcrR family transcriptional regulator [Amycolatopsis ruanii]